MVVGVLAIVGVLLLGVPVALADVACIGSTCVDPMDPCERLPSGLIECTVIPMVCERLTLDCSDPTNSVPPEAVEDIVAAMVACITPPPSDPIELVACIASELGLSVGPVCIEASPSADGQGTSAGEPDVRLLPDPSVGLYDLQAGGLRLTVKVTLYLLSPSDCPEPPIG